MPKRILQGVVVSDKQNKTVVVKVRYADFRIVTRSKTLGAAIASHVYDALRVKASASWIMGADTPRAILLGSLRQMRGFDAPTIAAMCTGEAHAPAPLSDEEQTRLFRLMAAVVGVPATEDDFAYISSGTWSKPYRSRIFCRISF